MVKSELSHLDKQIIEILGLLRIHKNVMISGPPATGKSFVMNEVANQFLGNRGPEYSPEEEIPLPRKGASHSAWLPSPGKTERRVFRTAFSQTTKQSDFLRGIVPMIGGSEDMMGLQFTVSKGVFYEASEHAMRENGTALLIIDEINRGPAVAVFGPSLVVLEPDKRLDEKNSQTSTTHTFRLINDDGEELDYALSPHLYMVAAMNQADTSVEPLDVAFLRRFASYPLEPEVDPVLIHFGISGGDEELFDLSEDTVSLFAALTRAWVEINKRIRLLRGDHFQIGHGLLMPGPAPEIPTEASSYVEQVWNRIMQHLQEVFFGDDESIAAVLTGERESEFFPLTRTTFAGQSVSRLTFVKPNKISHQVKMFRDVAGK